MSKFSDLLVRAIAGIIGAAIIIFCVFWNEWTVFGMGLIILVLSMREYVRIAALPKTIAACSYFVSLVIYVLFFLVVTNHIHSKYLFTLLPLSFVGLVFQMFQSNELPLRSMSMYFLGLGYIGLTLAFVNFLMIGPNGFTPAYLFGLFIMTWSMDVGGYFFGSAFGKHKLFEKVSPKKSLEGAFGGLFLSIIAAIVLSRYFDVMSLTEWIISAFIISVSGLFGDLVESYMKRISQLKDSGRGIPGHGGFLDRFDSLLFAIPFYLAFIKILG